MRTSQAPSGTIIKKSTLIATYAKPYRARIALTFISIFGAAGVVLSFGRIIRSLIDQGSLFALNTPLETTLLGICGCIVILALFSFGRSYNVAWLSERMIADVRLDLYRHLLTLDIGYLEHIRSTELVSRLTTDASLIQTIIATSFPIALRNLVLLLGSLLLMMTTSLKLTACALILVPIIVIAGFKMGQKVRSLSKNAQEHVGTISAFLEETLINIRTCYAFTHENTDIKSFSKHTEESFAVAAKRNLYRSILSSFIITLAFAVICALLYVGILETHDGALSTGDLSSFMFYALLAAGTTGSFSENYADFKKASGAADRLIDLMRVEPTIKPRTKKKRSHIPSRGTLAVHNVEFSYPTNPSALTLEKIAFTINPGEKIAIVGPSGAGKSTIFSLLMRFYEPQQGSIYIDGYDYKDLNTHDVRHRVGLVPQEPALFSATLLDNITYGAPSATQKAINQAIQIAQLDDVIQQLPNGIYSYVGPRGIRLSGGQKQRVAIARAILRNPVLLLLDEATSALDAENERAVQDGLKYLTTTRSSLIIAHRLSTVLHAERIIVLDKGQIQGIGTHAELCETNPLYRRLATLQLSDGASTR